MSLSIRNLLVPLVTPLVLGASLILISNDAFAFEKINVVTSIETLADLTREVGGQAVSVTSLSKGYMDPHFVEAKPNLVLYLHNADLLVYVGLELEIGWLPPLILGSRNSKIRSGELGNFEVSTTVKILKVPHVKVDRSMGDIHPRGNPHFWLPPKNALAIAKGISERLKALQPSLGPYFAAQYKAFEAKVFALERSLSPEIKAIAGLKVVPYHDSWAYVSEWLKMDEVGYVEIKPGIPPDPEHLASLVNLMKQERVPVIIMENFYNRDIARSTAAKAGAKVLPLPSDVGATPQIKDYTDLVTTVVNDLYSVARNRQ